MAKLYVGRTKISDCMNAIRKEGVNITPSTSAQEITPSTGKDGFDRVNVSAVTSSIDNNITANNIKKDVTILGVTGVAEREEGIQREVSPQGVYKTPTSNFTFSLPNDATDLGSYGLYYAFYNCTGLTSADLSSLTTVSGQYGMKYTFHGCTNLIGKLDLSSLTTISGREAMYGTFYNCTGLTSVDLSSLTTIIDRYGLFETFYNCTGLTSVDLSNLTTVNEFVSMSGTFNGCTGLTSVDLSGLTTISGQSGLSSTFQGCTGLTSVDLSSLTTISGDHGMSGTFYGCSNLTSVDLSSLTTINNSYGMSRAFRNCTSLQSISFPALTSTSFGSYTNQFNEMLMGCTGVTVHFPSNLQSVIGSWSDVANGFGGTNTTVLFDLPATT